MSESGIGGVGLVRIERASWCGVSVDGAWRWGRSVAREVCQIGGREEGEEGVS